MFPYETKTARYAFAVVPLPSNSSPTPIEVAKALADAIYTVERQGGTPMASMVMDISYSSTDGPDPDIPVSCPSIVVWGAIGGERDV